MMRVLSKRLIGKDGWTYIIDLMYDSDSKTYKVLAFSDKESGGMLWLHATSHNGITCKSAVTIFLNLEHYYETGRYLLNEGIL